MQLSPYIIVNDVKKAADFYNSIFGGKIIILNQQKDKILHAEVQINESTVIHLSSSYGKPFSNDNVNLILTFDNLEEEQRVYDALSENGNPHMPLAKTFFNSMHGQVKDQFGINWLMNCFLK
ncbi:DNA binding 3- demethylubiquinone-9 3-methyltransferase domain-containing protein [Staphylococcus piscifermentans]|uniref:VOC family protein n=1 Tax=Staphylococcus piscifermentans TaxID=70258 RepID=A0A239TS50_9STAP|nr:VOC family protein [Staphylococcus piscifermentans]GEP84933.1 VOC family protein [Staphylococcus piscifermentans]SNV00801.1 DNA binding 3- demethylubiquinone-9 3-methyltransferase domain-containing protein [Staphylococcus piscifermentans]